MALTQVTTGMLADASVTQAKMAAGVAGNGPAFSAYQSTLQSVSGNTQTKILFQTEEFDTNSNFSSSTFTPTVAGYYQFNACVSCSATGGTSNWASIYKNGGEVKRGNQAIGQIGSIVSAIVYLNGTTDYVECYYTQGTAVPTNTNAGQALTYFQGALVRAA